MIVCLVVGREHDDADPEFGAGCHPRAEVAALLRAILEALQARLTFIAGSRDDMGGTLYDPGAVPPPPGGRSLAAGAGPSPMNSLHFRTTRSPRARTSRSSWISSTRAGLHEAAAVDLTRPEIGIPVLRVVVPGLEGPSDAPDYVPGRRAALAMANGS